MIYIIAIISTIVLLTAGACVVVAGLLKSASDSDDEIERLTNESKTDNE